MSESTTPPSKPKKGDNAADLLSVMRDRLQTAMSAYSDSRTSQVNDLKFAAGSPDNNWQWPNYAVATRTMAGDNVAARPMLTINKLPQHIKQVTNDQRMNRPGINVIPVNGDADAEVAEVFEGIIRHIENDSDADVAYDRACDAEVIQGEGYIRILTEYESPKSFDQKIRIKSVLNPFSIYLDPMIQEPCGDDADWGIVLEELTHKEYETLYPDATPISSLQNEWGVGDDPTSWLTTKVIRIAEYYFKEKITKKLCMFRDGSTAFDGTPEYKVYEQHLGAPIQERDSEEVTVHWIKTNGFEILKRTVWPGKYIPIVRVVGNEFQVEGERHVSGIVRNAKDAQRMYNYHCSQEVEMLALAPKAPYVGASGQFEGFEAQWKTANTQNWPYLEYNVIVDEASGTVLPPPQRVQPPMVQAGIIEAKRGASEDIKDATGQYNASLGMTSNERSGKAILARQHEGDTSTYHYGDNLSRAVRSVGRQIVDLIPKIYDRPGRVARMLGMDKKTVTQAHFDTTQAHPVVEVRDQNDRNVVIKKIYNPQVGDYDVTVVTGKGYQTKRQEALESMAQLIQTNPELWKIAGDLFVKNMDWPGAQELAKRFEKTIPPELMNGDDPAMQKAQQTIQQIMKELQHAHQMLANAQNSIEAREVTVKEFEARIKAYQAETQRIVALKPAAEPGLNEQQIQDIAAGTVHAALQMPSPDGMMGGAEEQAENGLDQNMAQMQHSNTMQQQAAQPTPEGPSAGN